MFIHCTAVANIIKDNIFLNGNIGSFSAIVGVGMDLAVPSVGMIAACYEGCPCVPVRVCSADPKQWIFELSHRAMIFLRSTQNIQPCAHTSTRDSNTRSYAHAHARAHDDSVRAQAHDVKRCE